MTIQRPAFAHQAKRCLDILITNSMQCTIGVPRALGLHNPGRLVRRLHLDPQSSSSSCRPAPSPNSRPGHPTPLVGTSRLAFSSAASKQHPHKGKAACDHQIKSEWIQLVNPSSTLNPSSAAPTDPHPAQAAASNLLVEPALTREVLARLDLSQYTLIEVNSKASPPICKIVSREALVQKERTKVRQKKGQQKSNRLDSVVKEIQLSWKIGPNDLSHKLKAVQHCFEKGYKVRALLNPPARHQLVDQNLRDELLAVVEQQLAGFGGQLVKEENEGGKLIMEWHPIQKLK
ncbi:hypothetical protein PTTG_00965 [Puccinia triticina 1-1 BBBD Race 1]|uniref:IF3_N domain-containing protein n=1 Tax=Puccinia triticina (isolate 1-1 / race 1 (BBBD)) TaxID=630390 RepID=A0A180GVW8_PUCT1|nr:hypothetical protein PTTG_00965 [Puccinia triticina 1-1 BBBD Race 1]